VSRPHRFNKILVSFDFLTSPLFDFKKFVEIGPEDKKLWPKQMWDK
jgi:hypothetical protein